MKSRLRLKFRCATIAMKSFIAKPNLLQETMTTSALHTSVAAPVEAATLFPQREPPLHARTDVTVDELENLSLPNPAELYDGKVVFKMPTFGHGVIAGNLLIEIGLYLKTHPLGLISDNANYRLWPERKLRSRAPDISFVLKERLPKDLFRFLALAPDLAIEILSPDDGFLQVMAKVDEYLAQGTKLVWVVIASTREVLVCNAERKYIERSMLTAPELLPEFEIAVADIFVGVEHNAFFDDEPLQ